MADSTPNTSGNPPTAQPTQAANPPGSSNIPPANQSAQAAPPASGVSPMSVLGNSYIGKAVHIMPITTSLSQDGIGYFFTSATGIHSTSSPQWQDLPITDALGFPLRLLLLPSSRDPLLQIRNPLSSKFFIDPDRHSTTFGQSLRTTTHIGSMLVARKNGGNVHVAQVAVMCAYLLEVDGRMALYLHQEGGNLGGFQKAQFAAQVLRPQAFKAKFVQIKHEETLKGGTVGAAYATATNPVSFP